MLASPTSRLLIGLVATLVAVAGFVLYSLQQLDGLRQLQRTTIDRNRADSLQLLRIENCLHSVGLAMADMAGGGHSHPRGVWQAEFARIRADFEAALAPGSSVVSRPENTALVVSLRQFWQSVDTMVRLHESGQEKRARDQIISLLEAQHLSLSSGLSRLLVRNQEADALAVREMEGIYDGVERHVYLFSLAVLIAVAAGGLVITEDIRRLFARLAAVSEQRRTLAHRLIGVQEEVLRSVARELHDDFGQILTAIGAMIRRIEKRHGAHCATVAVDLHEVREVVQEALEKTRSFSQALHPTVLDDYGLERAIDRYLPAFEKQTGITVTLEKEGLVTLPDEKAIHVYRVLQEALTNVAKHSRASAATVRLKSIDGSLGLEVEDDGIGMGSSNGRGLGLIAMQERAELVHGRFRVKGAPRGGTLVELRIPLEEAEE